MRLFHGANTTNQLITRIDDVPEGLKPGEYLLTGPELQVYDDPDSGRYTVMVYKYAGKKDS